jgi:hypothetical protein
MTPNYTLERTVTHRGRTVLAINCVLDRCAMTIVAGRSVKR